MPNFFFFNFPYSYRVKSLNNLLNSFLKSIFMGITGNTIRLIFYGDFKLQITLFYKPIYQHKNFLRHEFHRLSNTIFSLLNGLYQNSMGGPGWTEIQLKIITSGIICFFLSIPCDE